MAIRELTQRGDSPHGPPHTDEPASDTWGEKTKMVEMALNHMTAAQHSFASLVDMAARLGFTGIGFVATCPSPHSIAWRQNARGRD